MAASDQGMVVTGAGHGIGRAIATRLAAEGARVVVNDLDAEAAERVAAEIGGHALPGDAATEDGLATLIDSARGHLGEIDIWFANAGIDRGKGLAATEADWTASLEVNVLAHVRAARLLLPGWVERGAGRFVVTASAAGLLTMLGSPTYSVSKHAAVAFAEWLSATYRHRGVIVQVVCPRG
nr:SDR family oxidoreductase [Parafrankia soli]